ncbi:MAG: tellurium resistance protein TerC [Prevotella sp.]|jgi:p-aminobenzoyl-glutamate transporter AbgT
MSKTAHRRGKFLRTLIYWITLLFALAQIVLILASWLLTAAMPDTSLRSLLSAGGIRWFFGNFATDMADSMLIYIIVLVIAWGSIRASGLCEALKSLLGLHRSPLTSQQKFALKGALLMLFVEVVVVALLTFLPHAILLSITGELFPSSFSAALIPILAFMGTSVSIFYSLLSRKLRNVYEVGQAMCSASSWLMPLLLLYVFASVFYHSFSYVFGV